MDVNNQPTQNILFKDESYQIVGAAMNVHNTLGHGFLEPVYQEALQIEFEFLNIPHQREVPLPILYRGRQLEKSYVADFICFDSIIVELKALSELSGREKAQVLNYLKATGLKKALLINFGKESLEFQRYVN